MRGKGLDPRLCSKQKEASAPTATIPPSPAVSSAVPLSNRFEALGLDGDEGLESRPNTCPEKHVDNRGIDKHRGRARQGTESIPVPLKKSGES